MTPQCRIQLEALLNEHQGLVALLDVDIGEPRAPMMELQTLQKLVAAQAADEGVWFAAQTCAEAHLQRILRELHAACDALIAAASADT